MIKMRSTREINNEVGRLIKDRRKKLGLSQMKLADRMGLSYQQLQKYESGKTKLSLGRMRQLSGILGLPLSRLMEDASSPSEKGNGLSPREKDLLECYRALRDRGEGTTVIKMVANLLMLSR